MYKRIVALSDMHGQLVDVDQINQLNPDIVVVGTGKGQKLIVYSKED